MKVITSRYWLGPQMGEMTQDVDGTVCVVLHIALREHPPRSACTGEVFTLPSQNDKRPLVLCEPCKLKLVRGVTAE